MGLHSNGLKLLFPLLLIGLFSSNLFAQSASNSSKALEFYQNGHVDLQNNRYEDALINFKQGYELDQHSEIAYAICHVFSKFGAYKETEKYANLALSGSPPLNKSLKNGASTLLKWARDEQQKSSSFKGEAKADTNTPFRPPPQTAKPPKILRDHRNNAPVQSKQLRGVYTIQQKSNGRYIDAHETKQKDFALVTRPAQNDNTQRWLIKPLGNNTYTIQQKSNGRYIDAHETKQKGFALVTRPAQNDNTQRWLIKP